MAKLLNRSILHWAVFLPIAAVLAWIYLSVARGDFVADDYVFITTGRMVDAPFAAFWQSHFYEPYYFRPVGVVSWWVATRLFELDYAAHSAINFALHFANAGLMFWLLRALALRASAVVAGAFLFALGPFALVAVLWPSNRFDLLAVGFLLAQAIAMVRALQGNVFAFPLAVLATLGACWSKESAYAMATAMAFVAVFARGVSWRLRVTLFGLLGATISGAFFWRQHIATEAFSVAGANPLMSVFYGAHAMLASLPTLAGHAMGEVMSAWFVGGLLLGCLLALLFQASVKQVSGGSIAGALLIFLAAFVVQTPLAKAFAPMLDGSAFGTVSFARFYYAPWAALSLVLTLVLARGRWADASAVMIVAVTVAASLGVQPVAETFAEWTRRELKPMSVAATKLVDANNAAPCVFVLLGTQEKQPFFRMFSDVTVKARSVEPEKTWRCHVMTESTPWLFAFPATQVPFAMPLREVPGFAGKNKADSTWGGIRYRYRLPSADLVKLPGARFFDWRDPQFVEVTDEVHSGAQKIVWRDW